MTATGHEPPPSTDPGPPEGMSDLAAGPADGTAADSGPPEVPDRRRPGLTLVAAAVAVAVVLAVAVAAGVVVVRHRAGTRGFGLEAASGTAPADYRYDIPAGAGAALIRGEELTVLPESLDVALGQVIEIRNDDDRGHLVGPFFVGANETVRYRFAVRGTYAGVCSVHPSGQIVINVA